MIWVHVAIGYAIWNLAAYWWLTHDDNPKDSKVVDAIAVAVCLTILPLFGVLYLIDLIKIIKDL